ncbi:hypothetical protein [Flavobacterium sp.]|uniref:hypothetical protein n=1 Tax=Flavobacterium sp. TaxID=239 RepID=UPI00262C4B88|nr:hypothetical protein [Flavobacterium sp.]
MRTLRIANSIAIGIPLLLCLLGFVDEDFFIIGMISSVLTGFLQLLIGVLYLFDYPKSIAIKVYFIATASFFLLWRCTSFEWIWILPVLLCIYLSAIIYTTKNG